MLLAVFHGDQIEEGKLVTRQRQQRVAFSNHYTTYLQLFVWQMHRMIRNISDRFPPPHL